MSTSESEHLSHEDWVLEQRRRAKRIATDMLAGRVGILLGARELSRLVLELSEDDQGGVLEPFVVIESETDTLPIGNERDFWNRDALREKDHVIQRAEDLYRDMAFKACRELLDALPSDV